MPSLDDHTDNRSATATVTRPSGLEVAWGAWDEMAARVREFDPSVVVLTPRKSARMREALALDFGDGPLVLTDLAVAFSQSWFRGARVAVVDDLVNVGSTISHAMHRARAAGASEVRAFAITRRNGSHRLAELDVTYACEEPLEGADLDEFGRRIPQVLQRLAKPYDLDFPLLRCAARPPLNGSDDLLAVLREIHGEENVFDLTTPFGTEAGVRRFSVDLPDEGRVHRKMRFYIDERRRLCHLMPISIAASLSREEDSRWSSLARSIWDAVSTDRGAASPIAIEDSALARLRLFCDGLDLGQRFLERHRDVLMLDLQAPLDMGDAELVLGPRVRRATAAIAGEQGPSPERPVVGGDFCPSHFLKAVEENGFREELLARESEHPAPAFAAVFELLADWVGANDPSEYRFRWPYTHEEVQRDPHLRLRIGPTVADLVILVADICRLPQDRARVHVTRMLDRVIDTGGVVPTTTTYDGQHQRIYRKGEGALRDTSAQRLLWAWYESGRPLSLTRASKLFAILDFSAPAADGVIGVAAQRRGNVLAYQPDLLEMGGEVLHYWADTKQIVEST